VPCARLSWPRHQLLSARKCIISRQCANVTQKLSFRHFSESGKEEMRTRLTSSYYIITWITKFS